MLDIFRALIQVMPLIAKLINLWMEKNSVKSAEKREALNVALEGLDKRDPSLITRGLDQFNRVR